MSPQAVHLRYECAEYHKRHTTEAGPPKWRPGKTVCPAALDTPTAQLLLARSRLAGDGKRYALQREMHGPVFYIARRHREEPDGTSCWHGHPISGNDVPHEVLESFEDDGLLAKPEARRLRRGKG